MPHFVATRPGKAYRCGHEFKVGDTVYYHSGVKGYVCSSCASYFEQLRAEIGQATAIETTLNKGIPITANAELASNPPAAANSREAAIAAMHAEKMQLLAEIADACKQIAAAEIARNAMLAASREGDSKGGKQ